MVTDTTRRSLLKAAMFGAAYPLIGCVHTSSLSGLDKEPALVGCSISGRDRFNIVVANASGEPLIQKAIPERGHGVAIHSKWRHAVAFARRPGHFFQVIDYQTGEEVALVTASPTRHYYGHGVYSHDGRWLYATEGRRGTSEGIIGVYDVLAGYEKVAEFTGFGLGPHEVIAMADGTLAIGVGGVHTDGRSPLNLESMQPSLSYLNANGELVDQVGLADQKLSIRHLAHDGGNTVLCGQQYRGEPDAYPPLIAIHNSGSELVQLKAEPEQWARFNHYIASIAATEEWILATSPRGNCYGIWSKTTLQLVELASLPDASGVVVQHGDFKVSSGTGRIVTQRAPKLKRSTHSGIQWDNHWSAIA